MTTNDIAAMRAAIERDGFENLGFEHWVQTNGRELALFDELVKLDTNIDERDAVDAIKKEAAALFNATGALQDQWMNGAGIPSATWHALHAIRNRLMVALQSSPEVKP